jgi:ribosomal protein S18 acetylase RimI-like enzyme
VARKRKERRHLKRGEVIQVASKEHRAFIRALSGEVFSLFGEYGEIIPQWFANPDVITLVYVKNGHPVGFAMLYVLSGEILAIAVLPAFQRKGIGSALLDHIQLLAGRLGLRRLLLHTAKENDAARLFFQKAGFTVIGAQEDYYPKGQEALVISKYI